MKGEGAVIMPKNYIRFWGTRGSTSVSGEEYLRFGGNTVCLEIRYGNELIVVDAGSGIRPLGGTLCAEGVEKIHLVISHYHWDHLLGFPFFTPIYCKGKRIEVYTPGESSEWIRSRFGILLDPFFFPVGLNDMQADIQFYPIEKGRVLRVGEIEMHFCEAVHPGRTFLFKVLTPGGAFGYATDNEFLKGYLGPPEGVGERELEPYREQIAFYRGCELLIHEAQYMPDVYVKKVGWGHSSVTNSSVLVGLVGAKRWVLTHHDPEDKDKDLLRKEFFAQELMDKQGVGREALLAYDGMVIAL